MIKLVWHNQNVTYRNKCIHHFKNEKESNEFPSRKPRMNKNSVREKNNTTKLIYIRNHNSEAD
jgi:hypothetical protein